MQSSYHIRGYSDFFTSGLRAANRGDHSHLALDDNTSPSSSSKARRALHDIAQRRPRPSSLIIAPSKSAVKAARRTSIVSSFSSKLFERFTFGSNDENTTSPAPSRRSTQSSGAPSLDDSIWISAGGPHTPSVPNGRPAVHQSLDPFAPSPDTRSIFRELPSDGSPKRESFLSMTGSSNRSSSIFVRRERPTSVQTMPLSLQSHSRRSSFQLYRPASHEKSDGFLLSEEEPSNLFHEPHAHDHEDWDAPAKIDWRQFHIDILIDDSTH